VGFIISKSFKNHANSIRRQYIGSQLTELPENSVEPTDIINIYAGNAVRRFAKITELIEIEQQIIQIILIEFSGTLCCLAPPAAWRPLLLGTPCCMAPPLLGALRWLPHLASRSYMYATGWSSSYRDPGLLLQVSLCCPYT